MNTQTHILVGWLVSRKLFGAGDKAEPKWPIWLAAIIGGLIPDVWMIGMVIIEQLRGQTMEYIWNEAYFNQPWQTVDAVFNSVPIFAGLALVGLVLRFPWLIAFGVAAALHGLFDLPVHNYDAHAHFWPLTDWKFISPWSYWEVGRGALVINGAEVLFGLIACAYMWRAVPQLGWRIGTLVLVLLYVLTTIMVTLFTLGIIGPD